MTKSKRKRIKKHAAGAVNSLLKKHPETKKLPTAASPKTAKPVNVLTSAAAAKPHVVSLTGKKKRKLQAASSTHDEGATKTSLKKGLVKDGKKLLKKKTVAVVGHSLATSEAKTVTSPKHNIAQVGSSVRNPQVQTSASAASPKNETTTSRKMVKKIMVKTAGTIAKPVATAVPATTVLSEGKSEASGKERLTQKEVKPAVVVKLTQSTSPINATKPRAVTQAPDAVQADNPPKKASPMLQTPLASKQMKSKACRPSRKSECVTTPTGLRKTTAAAAVPPRSANTDNEVSPTLKPSKTLPDVADASTSAIDQKSASPVSGTTTTAAPSKPPASSAADTLSNVPPRTPATGSTKLLPSSVSNEKVSKQGSGLKRQRSTEPVSTNSDSLESPAKRRAVSGKDATTLSKPASQIGVPSQASSSGNTATDCAVPVDNRSQPVGATTQVKDKQLPAKSAAVIVAQPEPPMPAPASQATALPVPENQGTRGIQSLGTTVIESTAENKTGSAQTQASAAEVVQPATRTLKATVQTEVSSTREKDQVLNHPRTTESAAKSKKMGIIMESHAYVKKMMKDESATKADSTKLDMHRSRAVALPPRPQNAWGASFGVVPPAHAPSTPSRTLTTTPLSSWFLSKGCANFVKQVHFSDDEAGSSSSDDDALSKGPSSYNVKKASPKRRPSVVKKNPFLESLTTQSNWRSWYGNVDMNNLLDPPLTHVPEMLRSHQVTPLALPETEFVSSGLGKKVDELGMLEVDIRREKQRGFAFSEQLLVMLQGKTVSGKVLEEEYRPLLNH